MNTSKETLIHACRGGDPLAWEALVSQFQRLVYSIPIRAGLDEDRAAEVFQRVFEKLVKHLDKIEQPERIGAWLTTTARRETWRLSRSEGSNRVAATDNDLDELLSQLPAEAALPDELLERLQEQHRVRQAVAVLDERCQCLLGFLFYRSEPPPYAEIASALNMPEGSIGPTRARCLQKLRRMLDKSGIFCILDLEYAFSFSLFLEELILFPF